MVIPAILLSILSIVMIYSSSPVLAVEQAIFALIGLGIYFILSIYDYRGLDIFIKPSYFGILGLLLIVFLLGVETRGSLRWIPIGPFHLQPSEFAKPILILALAKFWENNLPSWVNIAKSLGILGPIAVLVFKQPGRNW